MRHCEHWVISPNKAEVERVHLMASPGCCVGQGTGKRDLKKYRGRYISECVCYTCPHNTLVLGQGFNGQGA